jgi:hypothetical protein
MKNPKQNKPLLTDAEQEEYEERAAILEFDGKMARQQAETMAMRLTLAKREKNAPAQS